MAYRFLCMHEAPFSNLTGLIKLPSQALGKRNVLCQKDKAYPSLLYITVLEYLKFVASVSSGGSCSWQSYQTEELCFFWPL